jgi:hypothetical protein
MKREIPGGALIYYKLYWKYFSYVNNIIRMKEERTCKVLEQVWLDP